MQGAIRPRHPPTANRKRDPGHLQFATLDDPHIAAVNVNQDIYQGWVNYPQISILRALDARTGRTIGTFASVPTHGAHVCGLCLGVLSGDCFGAVRAALDQQLGGINVVGPASLGRLESPVETTGFVNAALLALNDAWSLPDAQKQQAEATGVYPIDRANSPPFRLRNVLGTWLTALRIGNLAFLSMPGEPFPEVRLTIARATGAQAVVALSKGRMTSATSSPATTTCSRSFTTQTTPCSTSRHRPAIR